MKTVVVKEAGAAKQQKTRKENLYLFLTIIFMGAGFFAPLLGMVLAIVHSVLGREFLLSRASTILFVASIPLLFVGSHFMDIERERRKQKKRGEFQKKNVLSFKRRKG